MATLEATLEQMHARQRDTMIALVDGAPDSRIVALLRDGAEPLQVAA